MASSKLETGRYTVSGGASRKNWLRAGTGAFSTGFGGAFAGGEDWPVESLEVLQNLLLPTAPAFSVTSVIMPAGKATEGTLVKSVTGLWFEIVRKITMDWEQAYSVPSHTWEELVAGAFKRQGFDEVILTPRSGDLGRDVIAIKNGVGSVKILGSVKAYKPNLAVSYDAIRSLLGVLSAERDASKGMITTTSRFPPNVEKDKLIAPHLPHRLELLDGPKLRNWLLKLSTDASEK